MDLLRTLKALADKRRLALLQLLLGGELCVGALAERLGVSKPAVSQHLRLLRQAGLVRGEKRGYWTHYTVERKALREVAVELVRLADVRIAGGTACWLPGVPPVQNRRQGPS